MARKPKVQKGNKVNEKKMGRTAAGESSLKSKAKNENVATNQQVSPYSKTSTGGQ